MTKELLQQFLFPYFWGWLRILNKLVTFSKKYIYIYICIVRISHMYEMTKSIHEKRGQNSLTRPEPNFFELDKKTG